MSRNSDFSYFSPAAPHTASTSSSPPSATQNLEITQPIITSSVLSSSRTNAFSYSQHNQHVQNLHQLQHQQQLQQQQRLGHYPLHTYPPPHESEELRQFAQHIPAPPQLNMPAKMLAKHGSTTLSLSSSSSVSPNGSPDPYPSSSSTPALRTPAFNSAPQCPDMVCSTDVNSYLLTVTGLPASITSDMVTISVNKGDRLRVNAQAWGGENAANFDWQISFPPRDVDLSRVQAKFDRGYLAIRVPRYYRADQ